jgi:hypothetical protein
MKNIIKILIAFVFVLGVGLQGCYEEFAKDFDYSAVYFGAQRPLRTLVIRADQDELTFKIGVALAGKRNPKGYKVQYRYAPELLNEIPGAEKFTLLPENLYTIDNKGDFTFIIPAGKIIGDCPIRIKKQEFVNLPGSFENTYALPFKLVDTDADMILDDKNWTIIVIKWISEYSGFYYCKGWQQEWDPVAKVVIPTSTLNQQYTHIDWEKNKLRLINTISTTRFELQGMGAAGNTNGTAPAVDQMIIELEDGNVKLVRKSATTNAIEDLGSSYDPENKAFTLNYRYTKVHAAPTGTRTYQVYEVLKLRQDIEKELRFEAWETAGEEDTE